MRREFSVPIGVSKNGVVGWIEAQIYKIVTNWATEDNERARIAVAHLRCAPSLFVENDRKPYGDYFGRIFRPKYPFGCGRNNLRLAVLHRKASFGRKTPFRPQDPPFRPQDPFWSRLKDPSFGRKTPFRPQDPPFGRKTPFGRILQLRCNWDLSIFRIAVAVKGEKVLAVVLYCNFN